MRAFLLTMFVSAILNAWTHEQCRVAIYAMNHAAETIVIGKVQKGIRPTKTEACHLPNVLNAYVVRCQKYEPKERINKMREMYYSYKYTCEQWKE